MNCLTKTFIFVALSKLAYLNIVLFLIQQVLWLKKSLFCKIHLLSHWKDHRVLKSITVESIDCSTYELYILFRIWLCLFSKKLTTLINEICKIFNGEISTALHHWTKTIKFIVLVIKFIFHDKYSKSIWNRNFSSLCQYLCIPFSLFIITHTSMPNMFIYLLYFKSYTFIM